MTHAFKTLDVLLNPQSIAVVGASSNPLKIGGRPIAYMKKLGYAGQIYPINPKADMVQGLQAYPSLSAIGAPVDLAIVAAAAASVEDILRDGIAAGVKAFVVFSSGFGEYSADGAAIQARLRQMCEAAGALLLGPNCLGAINIRNHVIASFTTAMEDHALIEGGFGFVSQSGALGAYWLDMVFQRGIGVSSWIATGNEAGITVSDAIHHLAHDPDTRVIGCYIEDIKDGPAFRDAALTAIAAGKPVLLIKSGRSQTGAAAAASHTGALAGEDARYQALFDQIGIVRVNSLSDMMSVARLILLQPPASGPNVGVISVSGGAGVMLADELDEAGFAVPPFDAETQARINDALPGFVSANNPLDVTGSVAGDSGIFGRVLDALGNAPDHDSFVLFIGLMVSISKDLSESLVRAFANRGKQVAVVWIGAPAQVVRELEAHGLPVFPDIPEAVHAMKIARQIGAARDKAHRLRGTQWSAPLPAPTTLEARAEVRAQDFIRAQSSLAFPDQVLIQTPDQAAAALTALTPPLAVKLQSPDMLHKSEHGGVKLGLEDADTLKRTVQDMLDIANTGALRLDGILLQEMSPIAQELIVGFKRDAVFGPLLLIGRGGVEVELRPDSAMAYLPLTPDAVLDLLRGLTTAPLFDGYRGGPKGDLSGLAQALADLGNAFAADPTIEEIEINPLALTRDGRFVALDALSLHRAAADPG
ncbi:Acyl-CoA synthetase (NDP forming) [Thalassovita litoralis]|jgi:acyl-CoA synthetase (NDP forming)|uniref:Acyl-CoA synthetase (NDP forming) n=1 Tax=Thalassovita litoralis TaxID=1010611 RepID=A0A521BN82_9RHOB|nr:acetate--CoA ligase family protein [Thalassovita litoralis]SMO48607.1 Acyl-CoA synthetase (NDP forming) [Thalassovita litoralis]